MRALLAALAGCALAGCGPAGPTDGAAATSANGAASFEAGGPPPPCTGAALPITGVCNDAHPALFVATDNSLETFARGCVWSTQELQIQEDEALLFRAQDCTGEMWDRAIYTWVDHYVKSRSEAVPEDQASFALEVFDVGAGQTAEQVALLTLANAPEDQRARCITTPLTGVKVAGRAFELGPNPELTREMEEQFAGEPWDACGPNGVTMDATQFWEGRKTHALFHMTGQDQPGWDPASFSFYGKNPDGTWFKAG